MRNLSVVTTKMSPWKGYALIGSIAAMSLLVACGDDSENSSGNDGADIVSIADKTVSGVSQKGPFVNGSSVTVQELDGESLAQTGASYEGKIKNDMGEFSVKVAKLASQYALLKANGFYRNEVTGEKSKSQVTLYALTDLSDRDEVNVNLLTHLAYERSLYLATEDSLSVGKAKKQAESEVLKSFGIEGDFAAAEDLSIFGTDEGAAALLAVSVLMQGDLSEADFSERLANYAADIEQDGKWDDFITATVIADWASNRSLTGRLAAIRNNIAGWGLAADVPAFEKYVDRYWWQVYSLGFCDKDCEGEVKAAENALSGNNGVHFICGDGAWRKATDIEKDTYKWEPGKDGDVKNGDIVEKNCYVFEDGAWRAGNEKDCSLGLRGCAKMRQDTVGRGSDKGWYICDERNWREATDIERDTATWGKGKFDREVRKGQVNEKNYYIYETSVKVWRKATTQEKDTYDYENNKEWGAGKDGEIKNGSVTGSIYVYDTVAWRIADNIERVLGGCVVDSVGKVDSIYYICMSREWKTASVLQYDTYKHNCNEYGLIVRGNVNKEYAYFCYGNEWKRFYGNDKISYGKLVDNRDGQIYRTVKIGSQTWMAENLNYGDSTQSLFGGHYGWYSVFEPDSPLDCSMLPCKLKQLTDKVQGSCPAGWHLPIQTEWLMLFGEIGGKSIAGKVLKSSSAWNNEGNGTDDFGFSALPAGMGEPASTSWLDEGMTAIFWSYTDFGENDPHFVAMYYNHDNAELDAYKYSGMSVRCVKDENVAKGTIRTVQITNDTVFYFIYDKVWRKATTLEKDTYDYEKNEIWGAGEDGEIKKGSVTDSVYKYDEILDKWMETRQNDVLLKLTGCTTKREGDVAQSPVDENYYACKKNNWDVATELDFDTYGEKCTSANVGKFTVGVETHTNRYYCTADGWVSVTMTWNWTLPKGARLNPEITYGTMTDVRDSKEYKIVKIGDQTWMAENLNYADSVTTASLKGKSWCCFNVAKSCDVAGRHYTWAAAIDSVKLVTDADNPRICGNGKTCILPDTVRGICPPGWHLPNNTEWNTLFMAVGGQSMAGKILKSQTGWDNGGNGTDVFGFSALPAEVRSSDGYFVLGGENASFWSSSESDGKNAYNMHLRYDYAGAFLDYYYKSDGYFIRCIKDEE